MTLGRNRSDAPRRGPRPGSRRRADRLGSRSRAGQAGRLAVAVAATSAVAVTTLAGPATAPAGASITSEQAKANQLAQQIVADGAAVQQAVAQENAAQARSTTLAAQVTATRARLAAYRRDDARAGRTLRRLVVRAFTTGVGAAAVPAVFDGGNANALVDRGEYSHVAEGGLQVAIATYRTDEQRTQAATVALQTQQTQAAAAVAQLAGAGQQAQAALARDTALLAQVKDNIAAQQAALAAQQRQAAAQEAALAAQQARRAAAAQEAAVPPPAPQAQAVAAPAGAAASPTAPGGYANPLRSISGLAPERIDQGVDYRGYGPLYAIGTGVVLNTVNAGWPGGTFITYRLTDGPAAGLVVYAAEDIQPAVQVGQQVTPTTVIGTMYEGPDGIETGWADPAGNGYTMAHDSGQYGGANTTAFGADFSQLLVALGAPAGVLQNNPPTGSLPANWPTW